jgi:ribonuclease P protein component
VPARFPRTARLTQAQEFQRLFRGSKRQTIGPLTLLILDNGAPLPRLGLAISRKHLPTAVARNRIKRVIREAFRLNQATIGGVDLVALSRPGLGALDRPALRALVARHFERLAQT